MILYHGSNTGNIKVLKPNQADHDWPYVYMITIDVVAAFYLLIALLYSDKKLSFGNVTYFIFSSEAILPNSSHAASRSRFCAGVSSAYGHSMGCCRADSSRAGP